MAVSNVPHKHQSVPSSKGNLDSANGDAERKTNEVRVFVKLDMLA